MSIGRRARHVLIALVIAAGVIAVALVATSLALDAYVHRHERELIGRLETRLGRKVEIGRLSVSLWRGAVAERA